MLERISASTRDEWLKLRQQQGIGASEAAAILGMSPWNSAIGLWKQKTGKSKPRDISGNPAVEQGNRLEPALRGLYVSLHQDARVTYHEYDIMYQDDRPWLFATLDGEIEDNGKLGVLEIKTAAPQGREGWEGWQGRIKDAYYCQVLHQLLATDYDFVVVFAALFSQSGDIIVREYTFEKENCREDMEYLLKKETDFWNYVKTNTLPPTQLV